ncbi:hypothetical protein CVIRNUC_007321 [Coccomyxa viridis]|uniref:Uncharacterized protein n=1 Tax=Coccomyxa viridis TaxID=1274662 RepID=A0AAV1IA85_9CHLO|nr:hypothetical protein CVIRNUC_007321 [Coccomyxa viridis]
MPNRIHISWINETGVRRRQLLGGPPDMGNEDGPGPKHGPKGPRGGPDCETNNPYFPDYYFPGNGAVVGSGQIPIAANNNNNAAGGVAAGVAGTGTAQPVGTQPPVPAQGSVASSTAPQPTQSSPSCDINGPNCCADNGLNSRLVPVTANSTLPALAALYFGTVPAGGGFIATPVTPAGTLASAGQIRVNQSLAGAPEAFRNATINLNRPAARQGPSYVFAAGSQVCIPNFFGLGPAAPAAAAPQPAAAQGTVTGVMGGGTSGTMGGAVTGVTGGAAAGQASGAAPTTVASATGLTAAPASRAAQIADVG